MEGLNGDPSVLTKRLARCFGLVNSRLTAVFGTVLPSGVIAMMTINAVRYKTGETCVITGHYLFDKYVDGTTTPVPTVDERRIPLSRNETFPPIRSANKACFWKREQ